MRRWSSCWRRVLTVLLLSSYCRAISSLPMRVRGVQDGLGQ
eukprot:gene8734-10255_t